MRELFAARLTHVRRDSKTRNAKQSIHEGANGQGVSLEEGLGTPDLSLMSKNRDYCEGYTVAEREK